MILMIPVWFVMGAPIVFLIVFFLRKIMRVEAVNLEITFFWGYIKTIFLSFLILLVTNEVVFNMGVVDDFLMCGETESCHGDHFELSVLLLVPVAMLLTPILFLFYVMRYYQLQKGRLWFLFKAKEPIKNDLFQKQGVVIVLASIALSAMSYMSTILLTTPINT